MLFRSHYHAIQEADFVPAATEIKISYADGESRIVELHDGSKLVLKKADNDYDPSSRSGALHYVEQYRSRGEVVTGLLFINEYLPEMHDIYGTTSTPLTEIEFDQLNPGSEALAKLQSRMR